MSFQSGRRQYATPWATIFFALLGLLWCGYIAFPTSFDTNCVTTGCAITRSFSIGGISLWWIGGAYFFLLIVLCLRGKLFFAWRLSQLALVLDAVLLLVMFFTGPCFDCLVVALFIGLTSWLARPRANGWFRGGSAPSLMFVFPLWFGLLLGNSIVGVNEALPRWVIANQNSDSIIRVYFAPSCPWCREAVKVLGAREKALLYPVLEDENDFDALLRFERYVINGMPVDEAIDKCLEEGGPVPKISLTRRLGMHIQLLRNKSFLLKHPVRSMPLIEINGMPVAWMPNKPAEGPQQQLPQSSQTITGDALPWENNSGFLRCEEGTEEPCD